MNFSGGIRGANHVGIATPNINGSVRWYVEVLGMRLLRGPEHVTEHAAVFAIHKAVFGHHFTGGRVAFLSTPDGFGIELFEIDGAAAKDEEASSAAEGIGLPCWPSVFHLAVTVDNVDEAVTRIVAAGGRQVTSVLRAPRCTMCYLLDPYGTVLEIVDRQFLTAHEPGSRSRAAEGPAPWPR